MQFSKLGRKRIIRLGLLYLLQLGLLALFSILVASSAQNYLALVAISSLFFATIIINYDTQPEFKMSWIFIILFLPIFGGILYLFLRKQTQWNGYEEKLTEINKKVDLSLKDYPNILEDYPDMDPDAKHLSNFITKTFKVLPSNKTHSTYMPLGEDLFEALKEDLRQAKKYIFLEFYILEKGTMLDEILEILFDKAQEGLDIRLLYDDVGNILRIDENFVAYLNENGIKTSVFNPLDWRLTFQYNYRDHRKIMVVDGKIGYTGGMNIGDNYINRVEKAGHWKDGGIRLEGQGVWGFTTMFLSLWDYLNDDTQDFRVFHPDEYKSANEVVTPGGYVHPFADDPTNRIQISESLYLKLIYNAKESIYLKTPYLIFSQKLYSALENAALSGVDVRIVTPGIPDKKIVFETTQSFYDKLLEVGVKIYEYAPGFIHEKVIIIDQDFAINGTINFDYRSLHHSFECGVLFYNTQSIIDMKNDFDNLFPICRQVSLEENQDISVPRQIMRSFLQFFAPLM